MEAAVQSRDPTSVTSSTAHHPKELSSRSVRGGRKRMLIDADGRSTLMGCELGT